MWLDPTDAISLSLSLSNIAVTLDGSILHRSGLITGGPSSSQKTKIWDEKDVDGKATIQYTIARVTVTHCHST